MTAMTIKKQTYKASLLHLLAIFLLLLPTIFSLEATFTPNPADSLENGGSGGPLPVSAAQRKQLLELDVAIANTPDPSSTLAHVAQQNGISAQELAGMLDRNRRDLQESGMLNEMLEGVNASLAAAGMGGGRNVASGTLPRRILSVMSSLVVALAKTTAVQISRHPRQTTLLAMVAILSLLTIHNIPKNGLVMSSGSFPPFSRGHSTLLEPPISYMQQYYVDSWARGKWESSLPKPMKLTSKEGGKKSKSKKESESIVVGGVGMTRSLTYDSSEAQVDKVTVETQVDKDGYSLVTTAFQMIPIDDFVEMIQKNGNEEKSASELEHKAMECALESISALFDDRKFSEYTPEASALKWRSFLVADENDDDESEGAVMSMRLLGDFGRFGIQPLCFSYELDDEDIDETDHDSTMIRCVAFHTLKGGHFDGELRFSIDSTKAGTGVIISVTLAIPNEGRTPPIRLANSMVSSLTQSIVRSSQLRIKQSTSRRNQSKHYRARAHGRAVEKRHLRYEQEKNQEEMAAERKRRWKRNNPDAGHYRPSGHRLRSPGGTPNFVS
ncbi:hypothetical protein HJC23_000684 [Cyclotella cryptica]|uniref:Uncharacterized protein n=1 Tax=Cyclotella cryptica TaxID=29204 RepID=A0ABD3QAI7_9STRA|eukprot:CCRYP_007365-RA/>CCRYP_007365-RA protein AED:0.35 eAED:0.35 QI:0/-1/0/1/-1/1/1/0/554